MGDRVERFEELIAWQKARALTKEIYRVTREGDFKRDFELRSGQKRGDFDDVQHRRGVRKNLGKEEFQSLLDKAGEVGRIIGGLRAAVKRNSAQT